MKIYYDTEFTSLDGNVDWDMISAGFVSEDGRELYVEIEDFNLDDCSLFVVDTVLPLLGTTPAERMPGAAFGARLGQWLASFGEDIELVSDASCDWWVLLSITGQSLKELPHKIQGQIWIPSENPVILEALEDAESGFWQENPDLKHHALYDARCLKLQADLQYQLVEDQDGELNS